MPYAGASAITTLVDISVIMHWHLRSLDSAILFVQVARETRRVLLLHLSRVVLRCCSSRFIPMHLLVHYITMDEIFVNMHGTTSCAQILSAKERGLPRCSAGAPAWSTVYGQTTTESIRAAMRFSGQRLPFFRILHCLLRV